MENGGAPSHYDIQFENTERSEPYEGSTAFPWMGQYQATPVEAFPTLRGPIVHEGFVPDDDDVIDLENQVEYTATWPAPTSSTPIYRHRFTGSLVDHFTDDGSPQSPRETPRFGSFENRDGDSLDPSSDDDQDSSMSDDDAQ
jgi:hypothetical protein